MNIEKDLAYGLTIHKAVGKERKNCVYAQSIEDVPSFLIEDGAVIDRHDGTIALNAIEGTVTRQFPVFVCWEKVSDENANRVPGIYGSWPKDNGNTTLMVINGKCYNLPQSIKASLMTDQIPSWVKNAGFPVERKGNTYELTRTDRRGVFLFP